MKNMNESAAVSEPSKGEKALKVLGIVIVVLIAAWGIYRIVNHIISENTRKALIAMAQSNAVQYFRGKYGFDAEIIDDSDDVLVKRYNSIYFSVYDELMAIKMKANGKEFYVVTNRMKESAEGFDGYQGDEVAAAVKDRIAQALPGGTIIDMRIANDEDGLLFSSMYEPYFDGGNLDEVLSNTCGSIEMAFADVDVANSGLPELLTSMNFSVYKLTSFDTAERVAEFVGHSRINEHTYELYAPYITASVEPPNRNGLPSGISYELKSCDDFQYCYFPAPADKYEDGSANVSVSEMELKDFSHLFEYHGEEFCISKPLSPAYKFNTNYGNVCIYYPLERFEGMELEDIGAAWVIGGGQHNNRDITRAEICGDYAVFTVTFRDPAFMLVDNSGQEEYVPEWRQKKA
ncbi:MAG: hypothetical protein K2N38_08575 [Oscillospiraceae bacterium]|nr:hypothetical protein [Oscillospiraceae bacterium]